MARVNVEQQALTDSRFVELGNLIGADRHAALGRMVLVWNECQERGKRVLSRAAVNNTNPDIEDFAGAIEKAELAREMRDGLYICGSKGRVEWLGKARKNGKLGGRPKKNQTVSQKKPSGYEKNNPPALPPSPSPAPTEEQHQLIPAREPKSAKEAVEAFTPSDRDRAWAAEHCPSVPVDVEVEAWKDRMRGNGYKTSGHPVKDANATWRTSMRKAEEWGTYTKRGANGNGRSETHRGERNADEAPRESVITRFGGKFIDLREQK